MTQDMIQIIEDEPLHAALLDRALRQAQFATTLAADGRTGWEKVQELAPSLILLDLMLPEIDGHDVCRLVRSTSSTRHIPIIMLSAMGTEEDRVAGIELGADDYVVKPFSPREVVSRVQAVLRRDRRHVTEAQPLGQALTVVEGPNYTVTLHQRQLTLSDMELSLLRGMLVRVNELLTVPDLLPLLEQSNRRISPQELHQNIRSIARKLENNRAGKIEILPGFRYRMSTVL
jgi:DNA-binding response OmpR family regulator